MATPDGAPRDARERAAAEALRRALAAEPGATLTERDVNRLAERVHAATAGVPLPRRTVSPAGLGIAAACAAALLAVVFLRVPAETAAPAAVPVQAALKPPADRGAVREAQRAALFAALVQPGREGDASMPLPGGGRVVAVTVASFDRPAELAAVTFTGVAPAVSAHGYGGGLALRLGQGGTAEAPVEARIPLPTGPLPGAPVAVTAWARVEGGGVADVAVAFEVAGRATVPGTRMQRVEPGGWRWMVFSVADPARRSPGGLTAAAFQVAGPGALLLDRVELWCAPGAP